MQSNRRLDDFVSIFSKKINKMITSKSKKSLNNLLNILMKRKKFAIDQELWKELYLQSIYFYPSENDISGIPSIFVTKHNEILSFYMKEMIHKVDCTILRFDTHSDLNYIKGSSKLPALYNKYIETHDDNYIEKAQEIVWDIGAAKSGVIMTTGIKDIVWCIPLWVKDKQIEIEFFIKNNKRNMTLQTTFSGEYNDIDFDYSKRVPDGTESKTYKKIKTGKITNKSFDNIIEMIDKNGDEYILDIDLDYFVCNGEKFDKSYFDTPFDLQSYYRTAEIVFNQNNPRNKMENTDELLSYEKKLNKEIGKIDKRIRLFLRLINNIKKLGYSPCYISICDSSNVLFRDCKHCNSISNGYVPMNLALYVHKKVVDGLKKIF